MQKSSTSGTTSGFGAGRLPITHRAVAFDFSSVPRHWWGGNAFATHLANGVNLLFPAGERFFVRSVRHFQDRIEDPSLRAAVRAFNAQEGSHSKAHDTQIRTLEAQGYRVRRFLARYEKIGFGLIAPSVSPEMRLAVTVALEHYTAILAEHALQDPMLEYAHPVMRQLLRWHAAEEIEHKAVAFDVLKVVNPSYALRMGGMALATAGLFGFWMAAFAMLLSQEKKLTGASLAQPRVPEAQRRSILRDVVLAGIREYARPDFHPNDKDTLPLARAYLATAGLPLERTP